jgi:hypothetical protein
MVRVILKLLDPCKISIYLKFCFQVAHGQLDPYFLMPVAAFLVRDQGDRAMSAPISLMDLLNRRPLWIIWGFGFFFMVFVKAVLMLWSLSVLFVFTCRVGWDQDESASHPLVASIPSSRGSSWSSNLSFVKHSHFELGSHSAPDSGSEFEFDELEESESLSSKWRVIPEQHTMVERRSLNIPSRNICFKWSAVFRFQLLSVPNQIGSMHFDLICSCGGPLC